MMRLLTNRCVLIPVGRAKRVIAPALGEFFTAMLDSTGKKDKLVVFRSQVRKVRINKFVQMFYIPGLKIGNAHFALAYLGGISFKRAHKSRITYGQDFFQTFDLTLAKKIAAVDDLINGLVEINSYPLVFPPFRAWFPFQDLANPIGVIQCLHPGVALGAETAVIEDGISRRRVIGELWMHIHGTVGVSFHFNHDTI